MKVVRSSERSITSSALWLMTLTITSQQLCVRAAFLKRTLHFNIKILYGNECNNNHRDEA